MSKISLIIEREYMTRVQKKTFILMTILTPIIIVASVAVPILLSLITDEVRNVTIVDQTKMYSEVFKDNDEYKFTYIGGEATKPAELSSQEEQPYAFVVINDNLLENPKGINIYSSKQVTAGFESLVTNTMEDYLKNEKLASYNIPDIKQLINDSNIKLEISTIRLDKEGGETETSTATVTVIGMACTLIIYMFLLLYGGQVMQSVMQEKTNRIVEVMVSSVKPFELMMGKIISIGLVGLTQIAIWIIFIGGMLAAGGAILGASGALSGIDTAVSANMASMGAPEQQAALQELGAANNIATILDSINFTELISFFILFFIGGYILYASLFAAIGSAVDNESDTNQFMIPITIIIIFALYAGMFSAENPDGPLSFWCSMIPFTSPIVMMVRIPYGVPVLELALSLSILYASAIGLTWIAGRIYRVGILMYGKKPSYKEMLKWIKYKA